MLYKKSLTKSEPSMTYIVLDLSGLNMMEEILTKEQWLRFPLNTTDANLNVCGRRLHLILTANADPMFEYITSVIVPHSLVII